MGAEALPVRHFFVDPSIPSVLEWNSREVDVVVAGCNRSDRVNKLIY
jgi:hypothetical protein